MRTAETILNVIRERAFHVEITGKPRDTESGHAWFGGGRLEKCLLRQLAGRLPYGTYGSKWEGRGVIASLDPTCWRCDVDKSSVTRKQRRLFKVRCRLGGRWQMFKPTY